MTSSRAATAGSAILLVLGGLAGIAWVLRPELPAVEAVSLALLGAGGVVTALTGSRVARRRGLVIPVAGVLVGIACRQILAVGGEGAGVAAAATCALVLAWAVLALGPGSAMRLSPALTVGHASAVAAAGESLLLVAASPVAALAFELVAWPLHVVRIARADRARVLRSVDAMVMAATDLRTVDAGEVGDVVCRLATQLLDADGAVLYVEGPGRLVAAGRHGAHPDQREAERRGDRQVESVLRGAPLVTGDPLVVPLLGEAGVVGAVRVHGCRRRVDAVKAGLLALFGNAAGAALDRMGRSGLGLPHGDLDPVTGVAARHQASKVVAGLRSGDGLVLLRIEGLHHVRATQGDPAVDLLLGQMGLHLRNSTRPGDAVARFDDDQFVIVLRELKAPVEVVVRRIVDSWLQVRPGRTVAVGAALHLDGAPLDTLERTRAALGALRRPGDPARDWPIRATATA